MLADEIILVTGAGRGRGRSLAKACARRGAIVAANDISPVNVDDLVQEIASAGGRAKAYVDDVAKKVGAQSVVNQVLDDFGRIDILIYHAAVEPHIPLLEMDEWDWHRVLDVNLTGAFLMTQSVGRVMRAQGSGVIFHLVTEPPADVEHRAAFAASMQALHEFSARSARELRPHGIHVYAVVNEQANIAERVFALLNLQREGS